MAVQDRKEITFKLFDYEYKQLEELNDSYFVKRNLFNEESNIERTLRFLIRRTHNEFIKVKATIKELKPIKTEMKEALIVSLKGISSAQIFNALEKLDTLFPAEGKTAKKEVVLELLKDSILIKVTQGAYKINEFHPLFKENSSAKN